MRIIAAIAEKLETRRLPMKTLLRIFLLIIITIMGTSMFAGWAAAEVKLVKGQTLYVPSYTSFVIGTFSFNVRATIFIHNTDPNNSINITRIDFYNTSGKLMEKYLQQPLRLNPLAATRIAVKNPLEGEEGMAAHFIIQWQAENKVVEPLVQGVFTGVSGTRGFSYTSQPRIIQEDAN
jgi:hypothetical protein